MGTKSSKEKESSEMKDNSPVGFTGKKANESRRVVSDDHYEKEIDSSEVPRRRNPRLTRVPKGVEGEQIAAGWPAWLTAVAGEAINGWLPRTADTFLKIDKIGQGTYSDVYKARDVVHNKMVALKKVRFDFLELESVRFMAREILILRRLNHPNVIKLEGLVLSRFSGHLYLVFEYMEHDLTGIISLPGLKFTEPQVKCYIHQLLTGLEYCHSRGILHRDIKSSNLLINDHGTLKIADFGLSTFFANRENLPLTSRIVTLWYRPPELLLGETHYGVAVDLWSTGCVLGELYAGKPIMPGRTEVEQLHKIFKLCGSPSDDFWRKSKLPNAIVFKPQMPYRRHLSESFKDIPVAALELMEALLSIDPEHRGTAASALRSEFLTTEPFSCDSSSLPKYPPSKEADAKLRERKAHSLVGAKVQRGNYDQKGSKNLQAHPEADTNPWLAGSMQVNVDGRREALRRERNQKTRVAKVQASQIKDNLVFSGSSRVPSNNDNRVLEENLHIKEVAQEAFPEKRRGKDQAQVTASRVYSGPVTFQSYNVDQLLEEHDRHIQEMAQKLRLEKRSVSKFEAQKRQIKVNPVPSGPIPVSINKVDLLLEEHDRQIQEATQRMRLDKKRVK